MNLDEAIQSFYDVRALLSTIEVAIPNVCR